MYNKRRQVKWRIPWDEFTGIIRRNCKEQVCNLVTEQQLPVRLVAEKFNIRIQLLYRWLNQYESYGEEAFIGCGCLRSADAKLKKHHSNYGRIRIKKALERENIHVSEWKIARIMRENKVIAKGGRKKGRGKDKKKIRQEKILKQNLIKDKFAVTEVNKLWCSDISECKIAEGKAYVCGIIDVASRIIVGWSIQPHMRESIAHQAFTMAYGRSLYLPDERYMHTDGGTQFTSKATTELIEKAGFIKSVSQPGAAR